MKTKDITLTAVMVAILIVCSQLSIPIGPVPITLQTLAVLLIGFLLTPRNAFSATSIFALMGLAGLPVFSGFTGGLQAVLLPSFGFIVAFVPASYFQAKYLQKVSVLNFKHLAIAGFINIAVTYAVGLPYMAAILNIYMNNDMGAIAILMAGFIPFIPGDLLKLFFSVTIAKRILPIINRMFALL